MDYDIEMNKKDYQREKEARAKRLEAYAEAIQTITLQKSSKVIEELIEERRRQGLTQQDLADMTGILAPNLARLESRKRVPTLVVLQKYASATARPPIWSMPPRLRILPRSRRKSKCWAARSHWP